MNKVAQAASEPLKPSTEPDAVPHIKSEADPVPVPAARAVDEKALKAPSTRDTDAKSLPEPSKSKKETVKHESPEKTLSAATPAADLKGSVAPDKAPAAAPVKAAPRQVDQRPKVSAVQPPPPATSAPAPAPDPVSSTATGPPTAAPTMAPAAAPAPPVPAPTTKPVATTTPAVPPVETETDASAKKSLNAPATKAALTSAQKTPETSGKVNGEIPHPPKETAAPAVAPAPAPASSPPASTSTSTSPSPSPATATVAASAAKVPDPLVDDISRFKTKGVFRYTRDDLVEFSKQAICRERPAELTDDTVNRIRGASRGQVSGMNVDFLPNFLTQGPRGASSGRAGGPNQRPAHTGYMGRPSQDMRGPPKKIIPSASLNQDVKLHTVENAWKPDVGAKKADALDEEAKTTLLLKNFRGFLNKITPQKYDVIEGKIKELTIDTEDRLERVLNLVFDKAVDEPAFCKQYATLCQHLGSRHVTKVSLKDGVEVEEKVEFRRLLIQKCQHEFERDIYEGIDVKGREQEIADCADPEKKRVLEHEFDEEKRRARKKSLGNMKLIGELYRLKMLKAVIMVNCIHKLISEIEDDNLECLCTLLRTIGQQLEDETQEKQKDVLVKYFVRLNTIVSNQAIGGKTISARVKCLIKDIIDLRTNKWQERGIHKENVPKTIDQIHKEVMIDAQKNRQDDMDYQQSRGDQRGRGRPPGQSYGNRSQQGNQSYEKDITGVLASLRAAQKKVRPAFHSIPAFLSLAPDDFKLSLSDPLCGHVKDL